MSTSDKLLDDSEVAAILRVTKRRVAAMVRRREIPFVELPNGDVRFIESKTWEWVERHAHQNEVAP